MMGYFRVACASPDGRGWERIWYSISERRASQVALVVKNPPASARDTGRQGLDPWIRNSPWRKEWQPTPGFLPGESHGQRSLAGCSPWGCKESDMTHTRTLKEEEEGKEKLRQG